MTADDAIVVSVDRYCGHRRGDRLRPGLFSSRHHALRQLADALRRIANSDLLPPGKLLIDYGCAERPYEELFSGKFVRYLGADLSGNPYADLEIRPDGSLPVEDGIADCVLSSQVLEHVPRPAAYLAEAHRVLGSHGRLVLSTHGYWPYHPDPTDYWRWTLEGLRLELRNAGFRPVLEDAVLGRVSTTLQLLQDAIAAKLMSPFQFVPEFAFQRIIGVVERFRKNALPNDASTYVVLAVRE